LEPIALAVEEQKRMSGKFAEKAYVMGKEGIRED